MKRQKKRAWLLALVLSGVAGAASAQAETFRCRQPDGGIAFQANPCPLAELASPDPAGAPASAPTEAPAAPPAPKVPVAVPAKPAAPERLVTVPAAIEVAPAGTPTSADEPYVRPSKRKRDILELTAQFQRCRYDAPGFAEKSDAIYNAWIRRYGPVLAEYEKQVAAKVRASRRGESSLPLNVCTDDWLRAIEPLSRTPDARFQTVEKTWQVFMGALMTGDRVTALNCLAGRAESRWKQKVAQLSDEELRRLGTTIRALKVQWGDDYEKEGLVTDTGNRVVGIAFRNLNEEWKITDLGGAPPMALPAERPSPQAEAPSSAVSAPRAE